ncbi:hypothetical protein [Pseudocnuella soli]|uniref:hypothetical protein n=1 Tax=Pseudocnuella soli TaxID=2502779 RepID=UPI00104424E6|nr:hypothetical protein [Pseudocnuella soli]
MDPEVKRYFLKILSTFSMGLLWMFCVATAGFYFKLALVANGWLWYHFVFYAIAFISFLLLLRYFFRLWSEPHSAQP